ncbi:uncharacterized protein [Anolis sagrei]|uniref:uncharacterized protein n=1 Tax=Anolis sagrei TaxID=38937 RepID=UPI0035214F60
MLRGSLAGLAPPPLAYVLGDGGGEAVTLLLVFFPPFLPPQSGSPSLCALLCLSVSLSFLPSFLSLSLRSRIERRKARRGGARAGGSVGVRPRRSSDPRGKKRREREVSKNAETHSTCEKRPLRISRSLNFHPHRGTRLQNVSATRPLPGGSRDAERPGFGLLTVFIVVSVPEVEYSLHKGFGSPAPWEEHRTLPPKRPRPVLSEGLDWTGGPNGGAVFPRIGSRAEFPVNQKRGVDSTDRKRSIISNDRKRGVDSTNRKWSVFPTSQKRGVDSTDRKQSVISTDRKWSVFSTRQKRGVESTDQKRISKVLIPLIGNEASFLLIGSEVSIQPIRSGASFLPIRSKV